MCASSSANAWTGSSAGRFGVGCTPAADAALATGSCSRGHPQTAAVSAGTPARRRVLLADHPRTPRQSADPPGTAGRWRRAGLSAPDARRLRQCPDTSRGRAVVGTGWGGACRWKPHRGTRAPVSLAGILSAVRFSDRQPNDRHQHTDLQRVPDPADLGVEVVRRVIAYLKNRRVLYDP